MKRFGKSEAMAQMAAKALADGHDVWTVTPGGEVVRVVGVDLDGPPATEQVWRVSPATLARVRQELAAEHALCVTQDQIDAAAPRVMRRLFPGMAAEISAAIAARQAIRFEVIDMPPDAEPADSAP